MPKTIDVPDTLDHQAMLNFLKAQGLDIHAVRRVDVRIDGAYVEVYANNLEGRRPFIHTDEDEAAVHRVWLPWSNSPTRLPSMVDSDKASTDVAV